MKDISYYINHDRSRLYPREKHATVSVLTFRQRDLPAQDEYLKEAQTEYKVHWLKEKSDVFQTEIARTINRLNARFYPRGKNKVLECLQFGGNREFWQDFPNEREISLYFRRCYNFAVDYIGYLKSDKNIICSLTITEPKRRNLFLYYLPITEQWKVKAMSNDKSENGNRLQLRDSEGNPIYRTKRFTTNPLLCHSEFWKQRGESTPLLKYTAPKQAERFKRTQYDEYDIFKNPKGI